MVVKTAGINYEWQLHDEKTPRTTPNNSSYLLNLCCKQTVIAFSRLKLYRSYIEEPAIKWLKGRNTQINKKKQNIFIAS